jgi:hypothetical protein
MVENMKQLILELIKSNMIIFEKIVSFDLSALEKTYCELIELQNYKFDNKYCIENHHCIHWILAKKINMDGFPDHINIAKYLYIVYLLMKHKIILDKSRDTYNFLSELIDKVVYVNVQPITNQKIESQYSNGLIFSEALKIYKKILPDVKITGGFTSLLFYPDESECELVKLMKELQKGDKSVVIYLRTHDRDITHCNAIVFNHGLNEWVRIEPLGIAFIEFNEKYSNYMSLDRHIEKYIPNYLSHNHYYYLPGPHRSGFGDYCVLYTLMLIEKYLKSNSIHKTIEYFLDHNKIKKKLVEYFSITD